MRTAQDIIQDYRARGYDDQRLRALANNRPEPVRSEMLALLGDQTEDQDVKQTSLFGQNEEMNDAVQQEVELELPEGPPSEYFESFDNAAVTDTDASAQLESAENTDEAEPVAQDFADSVSDEADELVVEGNEEEVAWIDEEFDEILAETLVEPIAEQAPSTDAVEEDKSAAELPETSAQMLETEDVESTENEAQDEQDVTQVSASVVLEQIDETAWVGLDELERCLVLPELESTPLASSEETAVIEIDEDDTVTADTAEIAEADSDDVVEETIDMVEESAAQQQGDLFVEDIQESVEQEVVAELEPTVAAESEVEVDSSVSEEAPETPDSEIAPVNIRHLTAEQYLGEGSGPLGVNVIDLRPVNEESSNNEPTMVQMEECESVELLTDNEVNAMLVDGEDATDSMQAEAPLETDAEVDTADCDTLSGEVWPAAAEVNSAASSDSLMAQVESSILYLFPEEETQEDAFQEHPAARRSLEVLAQMDDMTPEEEEELLAEMTESKVIPLDPPYACEGDEDYTVEENEMQDEPVVSGTPAPMILVADEESQSFILMGDEESRLIKFPEDMMEVWDAIHASHSTQDDTMEQPPVLQVVAKPKDVQVPGLSAEETAKMDEELSRLQRWVAEVEETVSLKDVELRKMAGMVQEREETLEVQTMEMRLLREELQTREERLFALQDEDKHLHHVEGDLQELRQRTDELQREYNIMSSETVPNLLKDKDDLVTLLEEKTLQESHLESSLMISRRRTAMGYTLAAAAAILVLAMPALSWMQASQTESTFSLKEKHYQAKLDQAQRLQDAMREEHAQALASLQQKAEMEKVAWNRQRTQLETQLSQQREKFAQLSNSTNDMAMGPRNTPSLAAVDRANQNAQGNVSLGEENSNHLTDPNRRRYNGVSGVNEWMQARRSQQPAETQQRVAVVRPNDGLSHVLTRELGRCTPELLKWVAKKNGLRADRHGNPLIYPNQTLVLPAPGEDVARLP